MALAKGITHGSRKAKARKLQQQVRDALLGLFPDLGKDDIRSISMGAAGEDILLSRAARRRLPFSIECKARKAFVGYGWIGQAEKSNPAYAAIVVAKANNQQPLVLMRMETFLALL